MAGSFTRALRRHRQALSAVLVEAREHAGITQRELARRLDVPPTTVARVELGERRLDVLEFVMWADALGIQAGALFKRVERRVAEL